MDHNKLFKQLLIMFFFQFVELFLPEVSAYLSREGVEFLNTELFTDLAGGERYEADVVARCRFKDPAAAGASGAFFLIHAENQNKPQPRFPRRMFHYFARLDEQEGLPVYPVAVFSYDAPRREEPDAYRVAFPDRVVLDFRFRVIQLNRLDWRRFAETDNPVAAALMAKMRIEPQDRPEAKLACVRMMLRLPLNEAQLALVKTFVDSYLRLDEAEEARFVEEARKLAPPEQEKLMEVLNEWETRGLNKGLQQGLDRERALLVRMLRRKVGEPGADALARIGRLPAEALDDLGEALLSMSTPAELDAWLKQR